MTGEGLADGLQRPDGKIAFFVYFSAKKIWNVEWQ